MFLRVALGGVAVAVGLIAALVLRCAQLLRPPAESRVGRRLCDERAVGARRCR